MIKDDEYIIYVTEAEVVAYSKSAITQPKWIKPDKSKMQASLVKK